MTHPPLTRQAEALLADLARDHGLKALAPDENGLVQVTLDDSMAIAFAFAAPGNVCIMMHVLEEAPERPYPRAWEAFDLSESWADRRTRIALEPSSGALMILRDIVLEGLSYAGFARAFETFASDAEEARARFGAGGGPVPGPGVADHPLDEGMMIIRP
jgi:hypothetical protein